MRDFLETELEKQDQVLGSWFQFFKQTFVSIVALLLAYKLFRAAHHQTQRDNQTSPISQLFLLDIVVLLALIVFDIGKRYIYTLHFLVLAQNYINFVSFQLLLTDLRSPERRILRLKTNLYFLAVNLLYFGCFLMSFSASLGPYCQPGHVYPFVMKCSACLMLLNALAHHYFEKKDFFLRWD